MTDHQEPQHNYFLHIPATVADESRLDDSEKMLFGRLAALSNNKGYCWASNKYLADLTGVKECEVKRRLKKLKDLGCIRIDTKKNGVLWDRKIYPNFNYEGSTRTLREGHTDPSSGLYGPLNNISNNKDKKEKLASSDPSGPMIAAESSEVYDTSKRTKSIKILENLGLNRQTHERLARVHPYDDLLKAVELAHKRKDQIKDINEWMTRCLQFRYWEEKDTSQQEKAQHYFELLKTAYKELQERFGVWESVGISKDEIWSYKQGLGYLRAKQNDIKSKKDILDHISSLNSLLPDITYQNLGNSLKIRLQFTIISGEEKINIVG